MSDKLTIQTWLGAALLGAAPGTRVWSGSRRLTRDVLFDHQDGRNLALFECVGGAPRARFLRSSRVDKAQVAAYANEPGWGRWQSHVFYALGHPRHDGSHQPLQAAVSSLRFIALGDAVLQIGRTGRGTIDDAELEELCQQDSLEHPFSVAMPLEHVLRVVAELPPLTPPNATTEGRNVVEIRQRFGWIGVPAPLVARIVR